MRRKLLFILLFSFFAQMIFAQNQKHRPVEQENIDELGDDEEESILDDDEVYLEDSIVVHEEYEDEGYEERPKWDLREIDKKKWEKLKKDKRFIYKRVKPKKEKIQKEMKNHDFGDFLNSGLFKFILYTCFGLFLIYIIYLFVKNNDISFSKNIKDEGIVKEEPWEDVRSFDEWEFALQKALKENDYRLATRIYYLHTLSILNSRSFIHFQEDKTNWFYVQKLFDTSYHDDFMELTKSFDYIWYGEYEINEEQFAQLQSQFKGFHYKLG